MGFLNFLFGAADGDDSGDHIVTTTNERGEKVVAAHCRARTSIREPEYSSVNEKPRPASENFALANVTTPEEREERAKRAHIRRWGYDQEQSYYHEPLKLLHREYGHMYPSCNTADQFAKAMGLTKAELEECSWSILSREAERWAEKTEW